MMELKPDGGFMRLVIDLFYGGMHYFGIILIAVLGSTANYLSQIKRKHKLFSIVELIGEWFISGFSALMVALLCEEYEVSWTLTVVLCGIAGHMGGRAIYVIESASAKYLKRKYPNFFKDIDKDISDSEDK